MAKTHRLEPEAEADLDAHLEWLEEHNPAAAARFLGAFEHALALLRDGWAEGPPSALVTGEPVRRWVVSPLVLYYVREGDTLVVLRAPHERQEPITRP